MKIEALTNLRIIKSYAEDMITAINDGIKLTKEDIKALHKLYELTIDVKNEVIYGNSLPF